MRELMQPAVAVSDCIADDGGPGMYSIILQPLRIQRSQVASSGRVSGLCG